MRDPGEIQQLKDEWHRDPCFDLWTAPGFEEHEQELREYQEKVERELELKRPWQVWVHFPEKGWLPKGFFTQEKAVEFVTSDASGSNCVLTRRHVLTCKESAT